MVNENTMGLHEIRQGLDPVWGACPAIKEG
jgi:hypothetical protein